LSFRWCWVIFGDDWQPLGLGNTLRITKIIRRSYPNHLQNHISIMFYHVLSMKSTELAWPFFGPLRLDLRCALFCAFPKGGEEGVGRDLWAGSDTWDDMIRPHGDRISWGDTVDSDENWGK
jgi:hypothetical protein